VAPEDLDGSGLPSPAHVIWAAIRPKTLGISLVPVCVGSSLAWAEGHGWQPTPMLLALCCALLIQIGTNLHNDAADSLRGVDLPGRLGPLRVTAAGWASAQSVLRAARLCWLTAVVMGAELVRQGGWPILVMGLASLVAAWSYSGGRHPVSHSAWGELLVLVFFGWVAVAGSHWLQASQASWNSGLAGAVLGLPASAVLLINNLRDRQTDLAAGRRTLASRLSLKQARQLHHALIGMPFALLSVLAWRTHAFVLLGWLALPLAIRAAREMASRPPGAWLNEALARAAALSLLLGALLSLGLWLARTPNT
jgi:1,4-dihydroxy-2-naphthoate polyprenyltransferase